MANGGNATQAALDAGYSERSARSIASENLSKPDIQARIRARCADAGIEAREVLGLLASQMRGSIEDFLDDERKPSLAAGVARGMGHLVKTVSYDIYGGVKRIELYSSLEAAKEVAKLLGLEQLPRDNEHARLVKYYALAVHQAMERAAEMNIPLGFEDAFDEIARVEQELSSVDISEYRAEVIQGLRMEVQASVTDRVSE